jgi:hypothetical protein
MGGQGAPSRVLRSGEDRAVTSNEADQEGVFPPLKIAMVIPPWYGLPPSGYGGIEMICATLVDGLCARGHEVTAFGAGTGTGTKARFISTFSQPQHERLREGLPDALHTARVNQLLAGARFDIVHDHSLCGPLSAGQRTAPTVVTVHSRADSELGDYYVALGDQVDLVAVSDLSLVPLAIAVFGGFGWVR